MRGTQEDLMILESSWMVFIVAATVFSGIWILIRGK